MSSNFNRVASFSKTKSKWGEFSNMHYDFPLSLADYTVNSSEALYQLMRFSHMPEIQEILIKEKRPMASKIIAHSHIEKTRPDFDYIKVQLMSWVVLLKFAQHYETLYPILIESGEMSIVEYSKRDSFWGACYVPCRGYIGHNNLGKIYMDLRVLALNNPRAFFDEVVCPEGLSLSLCGQSDLKWSRA